MSSPKKHIVFDVVGTLVSYSAFYSSLTTLLSPHLPPSISPAHFGFTWQTAAELEFTFLSISGSYVPYLTVLRGLFYRTLMQCGVASPRELVSEDIREKCVDAYGKLELRSEVEEAFAFLRKEGWQVWAFTTGNVERVKGYFDRGGVDMPTDRIVSCDGLGVAKPDLRAYRFVYEKFEKEDEKWFAAAHMWDVVAATKVGFRGAWTDVLEGDAAVDVFGEGKLEVMGGGLGEMVKGVVERSR